MANGKNAGRLFPDPTNKHGYGRNIATIDEITQRSTESLADTVYESGINLDLYNNKERLEELAIIIVELVNRDDDDYKT